jgi:hypothetical protein
VLESVSEIGVLARFQYPNRIDDGDAAHYRADVPHTIRNDSSHPAEAFLIVRYKENLR